MGVLFPLTIIVTLKIRGFEGCVAMNMITVNFPGELLEYIGVFSEEITSFGVTKLLLLHFCYKNVFFVTFLLQKWCFASISPIVIFKKVQSFCSLM